MTSIEELAEQLRTLGVREGDLLMVHASLRRLGHVEGRADGVVDALLDAIGERGTLLMVLGADPDEPFDKMTTPVDVEDMGVLAEVLRMRPTTVVNDHAAARYGAIGPKAVELLEGLPLHDYHGPGGVMQRFTDAGGRVLRLGADIDSTTVTHWAEYLVDVPTKRRVRLRYMRADVGEQWIESLDDTHGIVDWAEGDYFPKILTDFLDAGRVRRGPVGACRAELFDAPTFVSDAVRWMATHLR